MRTSTGGKRRDGTEAAIVWALRQRGARVWYLSGAGLPDLLVLSFGVWYVLEVKSARGKPTALQIDQPWPIVRTVDEAFAACGF